MTKKEDGVMHEMSYSSRLCEQTCIMLNQLPEALMPDVRFRVLCSHFICNVIRNRFANPNPKYDRNVFL